MAQATAPILDSTTAAVRCGAALGRLLKVKRTYRGHRAVLHHDTGRLLRRCGAAQCSRNRGRFDVQIVCTNFQCCMRRQSDCKAIGSMSNIVSGRQLRCARILAGLTQTELARAAGYHARSARYWESKENKPPTNVASTLDNIEAALRMHGVIVFCARFITFLVFAARHQLELVLPIDRLGASDSCS
jgi:DNA-binding XRE family transcriptional regulator